MLDQTLSNSQKSIRRHKSNRGFTLIELLIVLVIIGALAAIAFPAYSGYVNKSKRTVAISTLDSIRKSLEMFNLENSEYPEPPINFSTGFDNQGRNVFSSSLLENISQDFFSVDSYALVGQTYTVTAKANDSEHTVLTLTPQTITY